MSLVLGSLWLVRNARAATCRFGLRGAPAARQWPVRSSPPRSRMHAAADATEASQPAERALPLDDVASDADPVPNDAAFEDALEMDLPSRSQQRAALRKGARGQRLPQHEQSDLTEQRQRRCSTDLIARASMAVACVTGLLLMLQPPPPPLALAPQHQWGFPLSRLSCCRHRRCRFHSRHHCRQHARCCLREHQRARLPWVFRLLHLQRAASGLQL